MMRAGIGAAPITPDVPVFLAGFGDRREPAHEVREHLEARALCLADADTTLCLVVCDLLGMTSGFSVPVREAIATRLRIPVEHTLVACTHTHSGPSAIEGTDAIGWPVPPGYGDILADGCVQAAAEAHARLDDAELRYVRAPLPAGFAFNRRGLPYDDPWFAILDLVGPDGRLGVVANLSIHPVLLGPAWLAVATDWVGTFRSELESQVGGRSIELTGALGDINPVPPAGVPDDSYTPWATAEQTDAYGRELAEAVAREAPLAQPLAGKLGVVRAETIEVPVGGTAIAQLHGRPTMHVELIEWEIGDVRVVSIPGEAFHALGKEVSAIRGDRVLLAGIAPTWQGYLPRPWGEGYEEGVSYGREAVDAIRARLIDPPSARAVRGGR